MNDSAKNNVSKHIWRLIYRTRTKNISFKKNLYLTLSFWKSCSRIIFSKKVFRMTNFTHFTFDAYFFMTQVVVKGKECKKRLTHKPCFLPCSRHLILKHANKHFIEVWIGSNSKEFYFVSCIAISFMNNLIVTWSNIIPRNTSNKFNFLLWLFWLNRYVFWICIYLEICKWAWYLIGPLKVNILKTTFCIRNIKLKCAKDAQILFLQMSFI